MVEHLKIDGGSLATARSQIQLARNEFNQGNAPTDQVADSVGHAELGDSLRRFGADWSVKREKLTEKLATLEDKLDASIKAFGDWDQCAADSFSSRSASQGAGSKGAAGAGPGSASGGEGGGGAATAPVAPGVGQTGVPAPPGPSLDQASVVPASVPDAATSAGGGASSPAGNGHQPDALTDVVNRLGRSVQGWEALPSAEQVLLFTAIGTAGLTLLVRAGKLPKSVLDAVGPSPPPQQRHEPHQPHPPHGQSPVLDPAPVPSVATGDGGAEESGPPTGVEGGDLAAEAGEPTRSDGQPEPPAESTGTSEPGVAPELSGDPESTPAQESTGAPGDEGLPEVPAIPADSETSGAAGGASGTGPSGATTGLASPAPDLAPVPTVSELLDAPGGSPLPQQADSAELPPLAESLAASGAHDPESAQLDRMSTGMSAGMGMTSIANSLGGAANTANQSMAAKAVQEAKFKDAAKALSELRAEAKEEKK